MINLTQNEFYTLKERAKSFPVILTINGDTLTPITIFSNLEGKNKFILESSILEKDKGRFSFIGANPYLKISTLEDNIIIENLESSKKEYLKGKILDYIKAYIDIDYEPYYKDIPFTGGAIGYIGYDIIKQYEIIKSSKNDTLALPDAFLMFYKIIICYDNLKHSVNIIFNSFYDDELSYDDIILKLNKTKDMITKAFNIQEEIDRKEKSFEANISREKFIEGVEKAKEYIKNGDIFQVVLSQRLKFNLEDEDAFLVYRRLRMKNPSPYLFYIDFDEFKVLGSSPESLVTVQKRVVTTNPIAGTRKRGKTEEEDLLLEKELLSDEKECAEHVMLVDLGRNDIGKISSFNNVKLDRFMEVDRYSHVMHIVSEVSGILREDLDCFDAVISCLPVGTVSGAPKIRAMEIIEEIEDLKRGIYAGGIGYFSYSKDMDLCIAIRTIIFKENHAYVQAGAGIVYDSNPQMEYIETLNKAMALKEVL